MNKSILIMVFTALMVLLFTYTGVVKLLEHSVFLFQMRLSPMPFMQQSAFILSWIVPVIELIIASLLLTKTHFRKGLWSFLTLMIIFEIYISLMMLSGSKLPCTCGGIISDMGWGQHLIFNALFILMAIASLTLTNPKYSPRPEARIDYN